MDLNRQLLLSVEPLAKNKALGLNMSSDYQPIIKIGVEIKLEKFKKDWEREMHNMRSVIISSEEHKIRFIDSGIAGLP